MEYKNINFQGKIDLKSNNNREIYISGLGSCYENTDLVNDIVAATAFEHQKKDWEKGQKLPLMCSEHKLLKPIGKWIECSSDEKGLFLLGKLLDSLPAGKEAISDLLDENKYGLSIGYKVIESYSRDDGVRVITKAQLYEVSLVEQPANEKAVVDSIYIKTGKSNE